MRPKFFDALFRAKNIRPLANLSLVLLAILLILKAFLGLNIPKLAMAALVFLVSCLRAISIYLDAPDNKSNLARATTQIALGGLISYLIFSSQ